MAAIPGNLPYCTHRYAIFVSYLGSRYSGSQRLTPRQGNTTQSTVQEALEWALEQFLPKKRCSLTSASRTDAGVHAMMNCYSLPLMDFSRSTEKMKRLINLHLSKEKHDISVLDVVLMPADFHPRKECHRREYIYRLAVPHKGTQFLRELFKSVDLLPLLPINEYYRITPVPKFNHDKALEVINLFNGEHDFKAFTLIDKDEVPTTTVKDIQIEMRAPDYVGIDVSRDYPLTIYELSFKSQGFLRHQIRRMMGAIFAFASYDQTTLNQIKSMLDDPHKNRFKGLMAEPWGLYLNRIYYHQSVFEGAMRTYESKEDSYVEKIESVEALGPIGHFVTDDSAGLTNQENGSTKNLQVQAIASDG